MFSLYVSTDWIDLARFHSGDCSEPQSTRRSLPAAPQYWSAARHSDAARWTAVAGNQPLLVSLFIIRMCIDEMSSVRWICNYFLLRLDIFYLFHRSIALAKKWCKHAEWIRLDTAPFSSLTRDCGALLGLGMAQYWKPGGWCLPWAPRALSLAISSMGLYHVHRLPLPVQPQGLFYGVFFVKFVIVPQIVMVLVPGLVHFFTHKKKK